ncbi:putative RNA-directed DNA polymerase from transposon BS [Labeo rohita]|uniref:RNA-directed DNA polymerase from transposon BS n=1 Tax=Labeo rohita TaxID=84645 RepID=A0ABQ8L7G6_LABRO|nr:putative RNA-directed DNA polymerase from transposon BS [Labeo rohita]
MDKTEIIFIGTPALTSNISTSFTCEIAGSHIKTSTSVKNLGVILDSTLSFQSHIKSVTKSAFFHLRRIAQLRPFISTKDAETVIHAFVSSRIDFCNALFIGLPASSISRLQYIQNSAARILTHTKRSAHITPILYDLHWLPVAYRIKFKILLLVFKSLNGLAPSYLCNMLVPYIPTRSLRSSDSGLLAVPRYRLSSMGGRSFSVIAPKLWNSLPRSLCSITNISEFKSLLKTHLFSECYTSDLIN